MVIMLQKDGFLIPGLFIMCPRKEWCTSYKVIDGGMVVVGNNIACRAIGIGTFELKMHDGVVRTMEVRHIFGLEPNIISLGFLESHGYEFIASGGALQVFYGYLVAMMGKRHGICSMVISLR
ncbi:Retrovirus-related pol polyprotein from transposon tnt 1-94 [Thalictrum thalictroides]|uniref:Retrovirus-related pol polyprotein from transposon tnt 1-94 n=1 Tax=Thalictrum thalictroides TaxID=46969 RepID=A0A7J6WGE8_THATH|nr:Retrovirus-related pol polyprotein from transposon tnt 1-94 [Thalictrum thalictroides]